MLPRLIGTAIRQDKFDTPILLLGRVGENLASRVVIDASEWHAQGGEYELLVKRADSEMFTATITAEGDIITWDIPGPEIGAAGYGEIELNYLTDGIKAKSAKCDTRVFSSVEIDQLPPNGTTWSQLILAAVYDAQRAVSDKGFMFFSINDEGHLIYTKTTSVEFVFSLEKGRLNVHVPTV